MSCSSRRTHSRPEGTSSDERRELFRLLYRESLALQRARPWESIPNDDVFVVHVPTEPHPIGLAVLGSGGEQFGLGMDRARNGVSSMRRLASGAYLSDLEREAADYLSITFDRVRDSAPELCHYLKLIGVAAKRSTVVPTFFAKRPYKLTRAVNDDEAVTLVVLTRAILAALADGSLVRHPSPALGERLVTLRESGDLDEPEHAVTLEPPPVERVEPTPSFVIDVERLERLPRLGTTWSVTLFSLAISIEDSDETTRCLLVADLKDELAISSHLVQGTLSVHAAADHLLEVFEGRGLVEVEGLPAKLLFHEPAIMDLLAPSLERLGVRCVHDPETPAFVRSLVASLRSHLGADVPDEDEIAAELAAPGEIPAADDFDGWRGALDDVLHQGLEWLSDSGCDIPRLAARYFGSAARRDTIFSSEEEPYARIPFLEWAWLDHGLGSGGRSIAEEKLDEPLPTVVRVVLEALDSATTSLYKVISVRRGVSLVLEDLERGGKVTVHDREASRGAEVGTGFACRVITLGDFSFMSTPGRVLGPMMLGIAQGFLDSEGLRTTPKGLRDGAHLFGRLWAWSEEYMANVKLANTDGELVVLHEAVFEVTDGPDPPGRPACCPGRSRWRTSTSKEAGSWPGSTPWSAGTGSANGSAA
jgi:hypothetical protein